MTSEGSERAERRKECKEHVDDNEFRQQMRELIEEVKEQINREEVEGGVESSDINEEREAEAERESTDIDEGSGGDDEFRREMQELIAEVREISEKEESEDSDEFRKQMRELIDEVEKELEADGALADSAEDRLDEFEEDILENFEKYGIDGDEVRERWRERFVEDVEEELEKDPASDELNESTNTSDNATDSETTETAESYSYSESGDGTVQVLKTEGSSEATESADESEEHKAEMESQSESDLSVESEKDRAIEESNQKEDLESPKAEKHPEKQITHETESETSENNAQHELKRGSKESIPELNEDAQAREQTSETVSESSEEKAESAERKDAQAKSIETHSPRAEHEELAEEEVEDTQAEGHLNESDEGEVIQDSGLKSMQEWKEDGESEELADSEHLEEPDSTQSTSESYQEVLEENISPDAEELDEDEEVDERVASDDEGLTGMLHSPYPKVYVDETGFFAETEEQRWRRKLIELYNELPEEMKQLYRELVKAMLESEEGLEKLLDTFSELKEYEDFEEEHAGAIKYVKFRQKVRELKLFGTQEETTVKELALELDIDQETVRKWLNDDYDSFPKIIQEVWKQEIERRWVNVLRAIANRDVPYDMGEVDEILKRFPELKRKRRFGWHYDEVKAWTEVMAARRRGKIATLIIQGKERFKVDEVEEMAKRFNLTVDKVVSWLRYEDCPRLADVLTEKKLELRLKQRGAVHERYALEWSMTNLDRLLELHSDLKGNDGFEKWYGDAKSWMDLMKDVHEGKMISVPNLEELKRMSKMYGVSVKTLQNWLSRRTRPRLIVILEKRADRAPALRLGAKSIAIDTLRDNLVPQIWKEFEQMLKLHPHLKNHKSFKKFYSQARIYFRIKERLEAGAFSDLPARVKWKRLADDYGVSTYNVKRWFTGSQLPRLVSELARAEGKRLGLRKRSVKRRSRTAKPKMPESMVDVDALLERHPYMRDRANFSKLYNHVITFFELKELVRRNPDLSYSELGRMIKVSRTTLTQWLKGTRLPELVKSLFKHEQMRRQYEDSLPREAHQHRIDSSAIYRVLRPLQNRLEPTNEELVDALAELYATHSPGLRVAFATLRPYSRQHGPNWLLRISKMVLANLKQIEKNLNNKLKSEGDFTGELRLGLVKDTLYFWKRTISQFDYLNLFEDELFFFSLRDRKILTECARRHLGLKGDYLLSELIRRIADFKQVNKSSDGRIISDVRPESEHLLGRSLHLFLDAQNKSLDDITSMVKRLGAGKQIINPKFPEEKEFLVLMSRLFATIGSDGTIDADHKVQYFEVNRVRRERVKAMLSLLGTVSTYDIHGKDGRGEGFGMPCVLGRLLARLGMVVGDKVLQGMKLPDFIKYGPPEIRLAYLEDLIPEEGWFRITSKEKDLAEFGISRSVILYDQQGVDRYGFNQKIDGDIVEFLRRPNRRTVRAYGRGEHDIFFSFTIKQLKDLEDSQNPETAKAAKRLITAVLTNPPEYLTDECEVCESCGILMRDPVPVVVSLSEKTGRVSVNWRTGTASQQDVARWALQASPNDEVKRKKVQAWMRRNPARVDKAREQLRGWAYFEKKAVSVESLAEGGATADTAATEQ